MGIFSTIGNLGLGDFDESKILDNDSGAAARRGAAEQKETKSPEELERSGWKAKIRIFDRFIII